jgi:hypothetical protein
LSKGPAQDHLDTLFGALDADPEETLDRVDEAGNMPLEDEPLRVRGDLDAVLAR